jgi:hypothetical protein
MQTFETVHAEPRDSVELPWFRVNFWEQPSAEWAWTLEAHILTDAHDISEVLHWVEEHARGRRVEVFAEVDREPEPKYASPRTTALVRLLGIDPNSGTAVEFTHFEKLEPPEAPA